MRRKVNAAILLFVILGSMILPFGGLKKALAVDGKTVLNAVDAPDFCADSVFCTQANGLTISQGGGDSPGKQSEYSDAEVLRIDIGMQTDGAVFAHDQAEGTTGHGTLDWNDLSGTMWDSFYDEADFNGTMNNTGPRDNGFFVQVGTKKQVLAGVNDAGKKSEVIDNTSNISNFQIRHLKLPIADAGSLFNLRRKSSGPAGDGSALEILKVLSEDLTKFYQKSVFNPTVVITNLQPNTKYFVQLVVEEDNSNNYFWSNILEFTTKADDPANKFGANQLTQAVLDAANAPPEQTGANSFVAKLHCSISDWTVGDCFTTLFLDIFVSTAHWVAQETGRLFDAFAAVSIGSTIYGQGTAGASIASFVENGWSIVRDIANIFFIFILLYTALSLVLSLHLHGTTVKKLISQVIIIALLINFSLFFCRVTIDASNVLSRVFYNAMNISKVGNVPSTTKDTGVDEKSISAAIIGGMQPQQLMSAESLEKLSSSGPVTTGTIFMVLLISFIMNMVIAWIFFMCAAFFAGRIGVIWFSMIFAPLALVTSIVPGLEKNLKQLGWSNWLSGFMKACFNAPIFFFFIYLIVKLIGGDSGGLLGTTMAAVTNANAPEANWVAFLVAILLPTMIIIGLLMGAKKIAEDMAGEFGATFAGIVAAGTGLAAMAVTGGAAVVGRTTVGSLAARIANPESNFGNKMRDAAAGKLTTGFGSTGVGKWMARQGVKTTDTAKKASFDVRNTGAANSLSKATGVDMNVGSKIPLVGGAMKSFSTENTAGGFDGKVARQAEKDRKFADMLGHNKTEHDKVGSVIEKREEDISKQEDLIEALRGLAQQAKATGGNVTYKDPVDGTQKTGGQAEVQIAVNTAQEQLRTMKKGGDKNNPTHVWTEADKNNPAVTKADGTRVTDRDVGQLKTDYIGIEKLKKAQENIKTSRAKEYYNDRIKKSGAHIHDEEKRDSLGNITKFAHADTNVAWKQWGKNMARDFASGFTPGAIVGGLAAGPLVGLGAGAAFGLAKVIRSGVEDSLGQMRHEVAHLASDSTHQIHKGTSSYKSPSSGFTDMFKGLGSGGGGGDHGGGHDAHGGGGGDHGGGGHH